MGTIESHEKDPVNIMANVAGLRISWNENNTCLGYVDRIEYGAAKPNSAYWIQTWTHWRPNLKQARLDPKENAENSPESQSPQ